MANIKLSSNNWETSGIYDLTQAKTQRQINSAVDTALGNLEDRFDNLYISGLEPYYTIADLVSYLSNLTSGEMVIARLASSLSPTFFESGDNTPAVCYLLKAGSTNTYFMAQTKESVSIGNISTSSSTITLLQDLAIKNNSLAINDSISYPAYYTCGLWRTANDGTINLNFPATSLREGSTYTTTSTISLNIFLPASSDAATQLIDQAVIGTTRITTDYLSVQIAAVSGIPANRMGNFSTRSVMTITVS